MKKLLIFIVLTLILTPIAKSERLVGGIVYSVEQAREISFKGIKRKIDISEYEEHLTDKNYESNKKAMMKNKIRYKNRIITKFSDGGYSVRYRNVKNPCYYYYANGKLDFIGFIVGDKYPKKYIKYNLEGNLIGIDLSVSIKEQYMFDTNKKFIGHWIGKNCYNEQGELVLTRE